VSKQKWAPCQKCQEPIPRHDKERIRVRLPLKSNQERPWLTFHDRCFEGGPK